ncbi:hypothetical protein [Streptomyces atroolivaceus]|uniref:hypothetical protein n=1 Tax=Streptomyces atroolivaceus TaxID=66869 RepID=UPI003D682C66
MRRKELPGRTAMIMACPTATNRLKQSRAVATRYDQRGYAFLGTATAAAPAVWLRT